MIMGSGLGIEVIPMVIHRANTVQPFYRRVSGQAKIAQKSMNSSATMVKTATLHWQANVQLTCLHRQQKHADT